MRATPLAAFILVWFVSILALGGVWPVFETLYPTLGALILIFFGVTRCDITPAQPSMKRAALALYALGGVILLQLIPLPPSILDVISPRSYERSFKLLSDLSLEPASYFPISVSPASTLAALKNLSGFIGVFLLSVMAFEEFERKKKKLIVGFVFFSAALAVLGLIHLFSGSPKLLWLFDKGHLVFGPFVNRNHAGGLLSVAAVASLTLSFSESLRSLRTWMVFCYLFLTFALLFIGSRAGLLTVGIFSAVVMVTVKRPRLKKFFPWMLAGVAAAGTLAFLWDARFLRRIATAQEYRLGFWGSAASNGLRHPLLGSGAGTFSELSPQITHASAWIHPEHVENDYLEIFSDTGAIGLAVFLLFLYPFLSAAMTKLKSARYSSVDKAFGAGLLALAFHAFFVFHIPLPSSHFLFCFLALGVLRPIPEAHAAGLGRMPAKVMFLALPLGVVCMLAYPFAVPPREFESTVWSASLTSPSGSNLRAAKRLREDLYEELKEALLRNPYASERLFDGAVLEHEFGDPQKALRLAQEAIRRRPLLLSKRVQMTDYFGQRGFETAAERWTLDLLSLPAPLSEPFRAKMLAELSYYMILKKDTDAARTYLEKAKQKDPTLWQTVFYENILGQSYAEALVRSWQAYQTRQGPIHAWDYKWAALTRVFPQLADPQALASLASVRQDVLGLLPPGQRLRIWPNPSMTLALASARDDYIISGQTLRVRVSSHQEALDVVHVPVNLVPPPAPWSIEMVVKSTVPLKQQLVLSSEGRFFVTPLPAVSIGQKRWRLSFDDFENPIQGIGFSPLEKDGDYEIESIEIFVKN